MPILTLVMSPVRAAAILLPVYVISDAAGLWLYRRDFSKENLRILIPAGAAGIGLGWATASHISDRGISLLIGLVGLGFCFNAWRTRHHAPVPRPADPRRGIFWGTLMGFASFVSHSGAPLYQVYVLPQRLPKLTYAGTTAIVFAAVNVMKLVPYWALGQLSSSNLGIAAYLLVPAVAGTLLGFRLVRVLPANRFFLIVQLLLFAVSVRLVVKAAGY